jgi:glycosyltransferase involved in cell wall biosynthesis
MVADFGVSPASESPFSRPLRVLVIAELANPDWESVPLVGWSHWKALSRVVDGHLVTHVRNRENILAAGEPPERFTALDTTPVERHMDRLHHVLRPSGGGLTVRTALSAFPYYYFEHLLWDRFGKSIERGEWDIVHRITPLSPTTPSFLAAKCAKNRVPFVLGPLNGGVPWPKGFAHALRAEGEWLAYVRAVYKLLPGYRATRRCAAAILAGSRDTRSQIARPYQDKTFYVLENAVDPARFTRRKTEPVTLPLKVAFVGRFTLYKGADMLLEAAAPLARAGLVELDLIGDGGQGASLREHAAREGLPETLFAGWIKHEKLQDRLGDSDVFAFPSIREFGGAVVLEAMALGLVPIVMNYAGPAELVTPSTGFLLPMGSRAEVVSALRNVLQRLADHPEQIRPMGERARTRVMTSFTWDRKVAQVMEVYRWVLGRGKKPDFAMPCPDGDAGGEGTRAHDAA